MPLCRLLFPQRLDVFTSDPRADAALEPVASNDDDSNCAENGTFSSLSVGWPCYTMHRPMGLVSGCADSIKLECDNDWLSNSILALAHRSRPRLGRRSTSGSAG